MRGENHRSFPGFSQFLGAAVGSLFAAIAISGNTSHAGAAEPVLIELKLDASGSFEVDQLMEQCNRALNSQYCVEQYRGQKRSLAPADRAALLLASEIGLVDVQITPERLTLKLHIADGAERRQQTRGRLHRWFNLPEDYWTANHGLRIPADFNSVHPTLLVIHGLEAGPADLDPFVRACRAADIQLLLFCYPNDGALAEVGRRLNQDLSALRRTHPKLRIAAVGLSMGGLVARYCLETPGMAPCGVTDLFLIGTPNHGSALATEFGLLELVLQVLPQGMDGLRDALSDGLGEASDELEPGSDFLATLNGLPRAAEVRYHLGIGSRGFIQAEEHERVLADVRRILLRRGVPEDTRTRLITLLSATELRDDVGDGAVTMESISLSGCQSKRVFRLNHLQLLSLPGEQPERSEVFQWILETMAWHKGKDAPDDR